MDATYQVIEVAGEWIVQSEGVEIARFATQSDALRAMSERMRGEPTTDAPVSFGLRFQPKS